MKKIIFITSLSFFLLQCKKTNELAVLASDNDYETLNLKGRVSEISQKITILEKTSFSIEDKNIIYQFNPSGYLVNDSIFNNQDELIEVNTYEKIKEPLTKKQFINSEKFVITEIVYDSLKNIVQISKRTSKNQIIEEQRNTLSEDYIIREDYYNIGNSKPEKVIKYNRDKNLIINKNIYSKNNILLDSVVYEYKNNIVVKEIHYNNKKELTNSIAFHYNGANISAIVYYNKLGKEEVSEKFEYNTKNNIIYKNTNSTFDKSINEEIYTYTKSGKIEKIAYKTNDELITSINYSYNQQGDLEVFEVINYDSDEKIVQNIKYTYDLEGNWLTKEVFTDKIPTYKVTRTIKYYK